MICNQTPWKYWNVLFERNFISNINACKYLIDKPCFCVFRLIRPSSDPDIIFLRTDLDLDTVFIMGSYLDPVNLNLDAKPRNMYTSFHIVYCVIHKLPQIDTANHAALPKQMWAIIVYIWGFAVIFDAPSMYSKTLYYANHATAHSYIYITFFSQKCSLCRKLLKLLQLTLNSES